MKGYGIIGPKITKGDDLVSEHVMTPVVDEPRLSYIIKVECPPYPGRDGHTEEWAHLVCFPGS